MSPMTLLKGGNTTNSCCLKCDIKNDNLSKTHPHYRQMIKDYVFLIIYKDLV